METFQGIFGAKTRGSDTKKYPLNSDSRENLSGEYLKKRLLFSYFLMIILTEMYFVNFTDKAQQQGPTETIDLSSNSPQSLLTKLVSSCSNGTKTQGKSFSNDYDSCDSSSSEKSN